MPVTPSHEIDPRSGYCYSTKTYHSLRPSVPLPPESLPLSVASFAFSLLPSPLPANPAFIDAASGRSISFSSFLFQVRSLAASLRSRFHLSSGDAVLVVSPTRLEIPVLYFALLYIGAVPCPSNPLNTASELSRQIDIARPKIVFAVSTISSNLFDALPIVHVDSPDFQSLIGSHDHHLSLTPEVRQSNSAAILFSSGTTGQLKGVVLTHRNFIALIAGIHAERKGRESPNVGLLTIPLFHVFGFFMLLRVVALGETTVLMERFDLSGMLRAVERYCVKYIPVSPPVVMAMLKSEEASRWDLSSLETVGCGGAPLGREVVERFRARFPAINIIQARPHG
ncbi:hypothetical protein HPP92_013065 [Vanilla planifolia]|uniref:4-coumarate--CoA ligase n=1 Tax=Vanilla planifolia TaxID=51239 RepID=A0A835V098_VANPL|nr:hypothetical protein HPP92_013065 [Vanilla planifolia]